METNLSVREMRQDDTELIIQYWLSADPVFLTGMGVDVSKMPSKEEWNNMLNEQLSQSYKEKTSYCMIWMVDGVPVGHSNVNKIIFGEEAYMHLHLWKPGKRKRGLGVELVRKTIPWFFQNLQLKKLYCEPYALNPAPNRVLEKVGFSCVKEYRTTPGWLNFEQPVRRWELSHEDMKRLHLM